MTVHVTPGKLLLSLAAVYPPVGAFVMDWNETHIHNPNWPPHAKFHNAQTMSSAVQCAALALVEIWRPGRTTRARLHRAVLFETMFVVSQAPAILFPGTAWADPDTPTHLQPRTTSLGIPINQLTIESAVLTPLLALGYLLERRRVDRA